MNSEKNSANKVTQVSTKKAIFIYIIVSLFLIFEMALQVSPSVMSSQLMHALNIGTFGLGLMSGCYFFSYTLMQVPSGALFDRFNPRVIITCSITVCALGALIFSLSSSVVTATLARLLMGAGSAFAFVSVLVVTSDLFKSKHFATLTGVTQMLAALGAMSGQLPISHFVETIGWRYTLMIFALVGLLIASAVFMFLLYKKQKCKDTIYLDHQSSSLRNIFLNKQTWFVAAYACLLWAPMSGFASLWGVPFISGYRKFTPNESAFLCSLMWLGLAIFSPVVGALSTYLNSRKKLLVITAFIGVVAFSLVLYKPMGPFWTGVFIFISGAACSGQALSFTVVKENNHYNQKAKALALNNMAVVISGALVQPLIGWIISFLKNAGVEQGFQSALVVIVLAYVGALLISFFFIKETAREKAVHDVQIHTSEKLRLINLK